MGSHHDTATITVALSIISRSVFFGQLSTTSNTLFFSGWGVGSPSPNTPWQKKPCNVFMLHYVPNNSRIQWCTHCWGALTFHFLFYVLFSFFGKYVKLIFFFWFCAATCILLSLPPQPNTEIRFIIIIVIHSSLQF